MSANLVSLVMQFLTPDTIGRIAAALGLNRNDTQSATGAAIPALLAAFSNVSAQPGGAQKLADAAKLQTGTLGNFASMLAAGGESSFLENGSQMLSSLLGGQQQSALTGAIARFAGLGQGASSSLLGLLAPVVMGTIAQQQSASGSFNASGIASLLAGQKDNIAAAMPTGLANMLSGTGLLNSLGGAARTAGAAGSDAARTAASTTETAIQGGRRASAAAATAWPNWLYWAIPVAALIALFIYLGMPANQGVQQSADQTQNLSTQVASSIASLRNTLDGVTDVASAQAALPKVREVTAQIDKVGDGVGQLSMEQRRLLAAVVDQAMTRFNLTCDKALAVPGVAAVLKPSVDALRAKLTALTA